MRKPILKNPLTPFARNLLVVLTLAALALGGLNALVKAPGTPPFWARLFNVDSEFTLSPLFTCTVLLAGGLVAFANAIRADLPRLWQRLYWGLLGVLLVYLCLDEYLSIHETLLAPTPGASGPWIILYTIVGGALVAALGVGCWFGFRGDGRLFVLLFVGLGVMGLGGIGMEAVNFFLLCAPSFVSDLGLCHGFTGLEETTELIGAIIVLATVVTYTQTRMSARAARLASRIIVEVVALWVIVLVGNIWVFPSIEARLLAWPVEANYLDGDLSLVGYRISRDVLHPEENVTLKLYWRTSEPLPEDYFVSAHIVSRPDAESVAQTDRPLGGYAGWRTTTWIPGVTMRDAIHFHLPGDLSTPASYWLLVRVWWPTEYVKSGLVPDSIEYVPLTDTDLQSLTPDTMVLSSLPALANASGEPVEPPPIEANYQFSDGFSLVGYELPQEGQLGGLLPLAFWWATQANVEPGLTQFVHLLHSNGEDVFTYDQPPFGDTFPTSDWPAHIEVRDALDIPLPDDLPPGEYRVLTGMYVLETGERRPVTDADGQPVPDNAIDLGTIRLDN